MKLARNLSLPILADISGRIDIYPLANAARHTSSEDYAFAEPHGSVQQTLPDTFDCRAIFF